MVSLVPTERNGTLSSVAALLPTGWSSLDATDVAEGNFGFVAAFRTSESCLPTFLVDGCGTWLPSTTFWGEALAPVAVSACFRVLIIEIRSAKC